MAWNPHDRHEMVDWITDTATRIACSVLRHPIHREEKRLQIEGYRVYCPCTARQLVVRSGKLVREN